MMTFGFFLFCGSLLACFYAFWRYRQNVNARQIELQAQLNIRRQEEEHQRAECLRLQQEVENERQTRSEFLSAMSQELRTHLNVILGYTQIIGKDRLSQKQRKAIDVIHRHSEQLLTTLTDIMSYSQLETHYLPLETSDFNLRHCLWNIAEVARLQAEQKQLIFETAFSEELPRRVHGDEQRIRQILLNLLDNAVKFTERGKIIFRVMPFLTVASSLETPPAQTDIHDARTRLTPSIRFEIEDTGIGIPPAHLKQIFHPFHRIKKAAIHREGSGLALAFSQQLAELMGSEIKVTSQPERGSLFWIDLALPEAEGDDDFVEMPTQSKIVGFKGHLRKILIADDRYENRVVLKEMLLPLGFGIIEAVDGFDVLAKAAQHHPEMILIDVSMPVLNGFEVIRHVRQIPGLDQAIVIGMSASLMRQIRDESMKAGSNDFLEKPIRFETLISCLQRYLNMEWVYETAEILA
ncbi:sensor protein [Candidatus Moduliflexus flocculans]|uniref:histidine kinase n=1 Tax=Candidatus Moduliflexus flocculans TaxID=1499966 RepID=A0A081BN07_9BACT|nr:sensor protein [Candidatus Moduliflexus flocculans]